MKTPYSLVDRSFADKAHLQALSYVYRPFFGKGTVKRATDEQDMKHGIDYIICVFSPSLPVEPITFTVQERFRRKLYGDITLSEYLENSGTPSEVYRCRADFYLYGGYDEGTGEITEAVLVWMQALRAGIATGTVPYGRNVSPKQNKRFLTISLEILKNRDLIAYHYQKDTDCKVLIA